MEVWPLLHVGNYLQPMSRKQEILDDCRNTSK